MAELFTVPNLIAFLTLSALEIVLGIDNIVFIAILCGKLPAHLRDKARRIGLFLAMFMRIGLLLSISWIMTLTTPLFDISQLWGGSEQTHTQPATAEAHAPSAAAHDENPWEISGKDLILLVGGLFLVAKATHEIHDKLETEEGHEANPRDVSGFAGVITQIVLLDIVFSLDSVITAVGMVPTKKGSEWVGLTVMITAVMMAVAVMLLFSGPIVRFIDKHPTLKMLALSFLVLIGVMLMVEGFGQHVNKGYIYFAMAFSVAVEMLNIAVRRKAHKPLHLHNVAPTDDASRAQLPGKK